MRRMTVSSYAALAKTLLISMGKFEFLKTSSFDITLSKTDSLSSEFELSLLSRFVLKVTIMVIIVR
jgi:hypothetical protein